MSSSMADVCIFVLTAWRQNIQQRYLRRGTIAFPIASSSTIRVLLRHIHSLCSHTAFWRRYVGKHRGLNYMFGLDSEITLDAAFVGNETRYINHGDERDENVVARGVYTRHGLSQQAD